VEQLLDVKPFAWLLEARMLCGPNQLQICRRRWWALAVLEMIELNVLAYWNNKPLKSPLPLAKCPYPMDGNYHVFSGVLQHKDHSM
jgi:hypothetical protein